MPETLQPPREFAEKVIKDAVTDGRLPGDDASARAAALTPSFSKGTVPLDENGQAVLPKDQQKPPTFTEGRRDLPAATDTTGGTETAAPATAAADGAAVAAAKPAEPPAQAAGAAAAEATAGAIAEDWEDFEFEEPDLSKPDSPVKIKLRAPKQFAEIAKRGYGRRQAYDRAVNYLRTAEPVLKQMIEDGRINRVLPLIQAAVENRNGFGETVTAMFERMQRGEPLVAAAIAEAATARIAPASDPTLEAALQDPLYGDTLKPIVEGQQALRSELDEWKRERETQRKTQDETAQRNAQLANDMRAAHEDLARMYPDRFNLALRENDPAWQQAMRCAREGDYINKYRSTTAGIIFGGQSWIAMEAEREAAMASPAAAAISVRDHLDENARREAASVAATAAGGAAAHTTAVAPPPKPGTKYPVGTVDPRTGKDLSGQLKPQELYMAEIQNWHRQHGALKQA